MISEERIEGYRLSPAETDVDLFTRYFWNTALSEALYPLLQALEVALRNTMDEALKSTVNPGWLTMVPPVLKANEQQMVREAISRIRAARHPATPGRIVAALSFGFWTGLLDARYEQVFWPKGLRVAFPHVPRRQRTRSNIMHRVDSIRRLRNRVFHHEPIWRYPNLVQLHAEAVETLGWIDPTLRSLVSATDRFPSIHVSGPAAHRALIEREIHAG